MTKNFKKLAGAIQKDISPKTKKKWWNNKSVPRDKGLIKHNQVSLLQLKNEERYHAGTETVRQRIY